MKKDIIVSLTSWSKRIPYICKTLNSILNQDIKPNSIELNLAIPEFPNKEKDLPIDLIELIKTNKIIHINWVNENTGVFKKIIPTIQKYYGKDYWLISIDDDIIYRHDFINKMINGIINKKSDSYCYSNSCIIGNRTIYNSLSFEQDFWELLNDEIIKCRIDDTYIHDYLSYKRKKMSCEISKPTDINDVIKCWNGLYYPNSHDSIHGIYPHNDVIKAQNAINKVFKNK